MGPGEGVRTARPNSCADWREFVSLGAPNCCHSTQCLPGVRSYKSSVVESSGVKPCERHLRRGVEPHLFLEFPSALHNERHGLYEKFCNNK